MNCENCVWHQSCSNDAWQRCEYFTPTDDYEEMVEVDGRWYTPEEALLLHIMEELDD